MTDRIEDISRELDKYSASEHRNMLAFISGYDPTAFNSAARQITETRDRAATRKIKETRERAVK